MRRNSLPVIIGKGLQKGICASKSQLMGDGVDLSIVWLKKPFKSGARITREDIDRVNIVLHFCDKESVARTIDMLTEVLVKW